MLLTMFVNSFHFIYEENASVLIFSPVS